MPAGDMRLNAPHPLGIEPEWVWRARRRKELCEAITRRVDACYAISREGEVATSPAALLEPCVAWLDELKAHVEWEIARTLRKDDRA